jgi:hypothetical protein
MLAANPERTRDLSLSAALRFLKGKNSPNKSSETPARRKTTSPALSARAWTEASADERAKFLIAVGLPSLLKALAAAFQIEIAHRPAGTSTAGQFELASVAQETRH